MIFYVYYAIVSWFKRAHPDDNIDDFDDLINEKFEKRFLERLYELTKKKKISIHNIYFCIDCPQKNIWRLNIDSNYKKTRKKDIKVAKAFVYLFKNISNNLEKKGIKFIKEDMAEGDDIASIIVRKLQENKINTIFIITSDHDYLQLINDNTFIYTLNNKNIKDKSYGNPELDLHIKIIIGDKSDNIPSIFPKCGIKSALKIINNNSLDEIFEKYKDSFERYEKNKILIDFENIPTNIKKNISDKLIKE
jgi:5'-3' exonuclease